MRSYRRALYNGLFASGGLRKVFQGFSGGSSGLVGFSAGSARFFRAFQEGLIDI